jgi:CheY-like chemotaxis protein
MKRILYIDDAPDTLALVQAYLQRELPDTMVEVGCTAADAEVFLNSRCYDLVILDVNLPGELGTDIAEKILQADPGQPIYLMSEYTGAVKEDAARVGLALHPHPKFSQRDPAEFLADVELLLKKRPCDSLGNSQTIGEDSATDVARGEAAAPTKQIRLTSPHVAAARAASSV